MERIVDQGAYQKYSSEQAFNLSIVILSLERKELELINSAGIKEQAGNYNDDNNINKITLSYANAGDVVFRYFLAAIISFVAMFIILFCYISHQEIDVVLTNAGVIKKASFGFALLGLELFLFSIGWTCIKLGFHHQGIKDSLKWYHFVRPLHDADETKGIIIEIFTLIAHPPQIGKSDILLFKSINAARRLLGEITKAGNIVKGDS